MKQIKMNLIAYVVEYKYQKSIYHVSSKNSWLRALDTLFSEKAEGFV